MKGARGINWYNGESSIDRANNQIRIGIMQREGFTLDEKNDIYIKQEYGAYMCSIPQNVKEISELYNKEFNGRYNIILSLTEKGYKLIIGPGAPGSDGKVLNKGLYCENYEEIIKKENTAKSNENDGDEGR